MSGGSRIVSLGSGEEPGEAQHFAMAATEPVQPEEEIWDETEEFEHPAPSPFIAYLPALALGVVVLWTGFFGWANSQAMSTGASPAQWAEWIGTWAVPVLLVVALWLLGMRNSQREAGRFNDVARLLSQESAQLETRLATVNRELSLAREFIASQSRDLESLGRVSVERISQHADRLASLIQDNSAQVESIASVSSNALENMGKLRNELPVIANSARDVTNQIGNAGRVAQDHLQELTSGFQRMHEFGDAAEQQVQAVRAQVDAALAAFAMQATKLEDIATGRFAALNERSLAFRTELDGQEVEMLAAIRRRAQSLSDEMAAARAQLADQETQSLEALRAHIAALSDRVTTLGQDIRTNENSAMTAWTQAVGELETRLHGATGEIARIDAQAQEAAAASRALWDDEFTRRRERAESWQAEQLADTREHLENLDAAIAERREAHLAASHEIAQHADAITTRLAGLSARIEEIGAQGHAVRNELGEALAALGTKIATSRDTVAETDQAVASLTEASVRLLEIIRAGAQHSREDLPAAISNADQHLGSFTGNVEAVNRLISDAHDKGRLLSDYVQTAQRDGVSVMKEVEQFHATFAAYNEGHAEQLALFRNELAALGKESEALAAEREQHLRNSLEQLAEATRSAISSLEQDGADAAARLASRIGDDSAQAIDRAVRARSAEAVGQLEQAAAHAAGVSREAAIQLRDQLAKVTDLTNHLEMRVARARERAAEQVDNDFARRAALITEALNSSAIDIARVLSTDVSDTAWAAYLRGDRGIFTRRAVRLLDSGESRIVSDTYQNDANFRAHVNRYVHDFEAMLRELLSTRDGHAMSVTLLSADMGKLYVALAQAIERLRQ
ncbi:hypothetical protein [Caenibius sp. WL]|uniref:hypothetical protein n=1 Tax=Caenibius sp. WL TaxID=2872646 RepID=UPI001C9A07F4|nr:hypothetical protein [Caenibius sp. WL]QZP07001.1 ATPase [Caenibius sp. WL]